MAWQVEFLAFEPQPENTRNIQVRARFFNGAEELFDRTFGFDLTYDRAVKWAKANIDVLIARDAAIAALAGQTGAVTFPAPTAEEIAIAAFVTKAQAFHQLRQRAANGIINSDSPAIAAAQTDMRAAWQPEFAGKTPFG